jgi:DNA-binding MarR family transcriptional regulator
MPSRLQREIKKKQPFAALEQEAFLSIARTADQLEVRVERLMRDYGLTGSQYNILRILRGEGQPLPMVEIASRTVKVVPGITGLIDRLEAGGFVKRERSTEDRRVVFVSITERALEILAQLDEPVKAFEKRLLGFLSQAEQRELIRLLEKIRAHLEQPDQHAAFSGR